MHGKFYPRLCGMIILPLLILTFALAGESVALPQLLNSSAGMADSPQNLRVSLSLDKQLRRMPLRPDDVSVWIYPSAFMPQQGKIERYQCRGIMLWRAGELLFMDLRQPPHQKSGGKFTALVEISFDEKVVYSQVCRTPVSYEASQANVALVIDCSQSMAHNDKQRNRIAAARAFIETAARDGRIGRVCVIGFSDIARELCPLMQLDAAGKERLLKSLAKIGSSGQTNIGLSLRQTLSSLQKAPGGRNAVVLLTDGKNESLAYGDEHLELAVRGIPVYSIGLCEGADTRLLDKISSETGGKSYHAATSRELMATYQQIAAEIMRSKVIISERVRDHADFTVPVDSSIKELNFSLDAPIQQAKLILQSPDGNSSVLDYSGENYQQLRIPNPQDGLWLVRVENNSAALPVTLSITARTDFYLDIFPPVKIGENLCFAATLANGNKPISGMQACLIPGFGCKPVQLFDDGAHFDGEAGDGVYAARMNMPQRAQLLARAWGGKEEEFLRQADCGLLSSTDMVEVKTPLLVCSKEIDFGSCVAGGVLNARMELTAQDVDGEFCMSWKSLDGTITQPVVINRDLLKNADKVSSELILKTPLSFNAGEYTLRGTAHIGNAQCPVKAKFTVLPPKIKLAIQKVSLGTLRPGQRLKTRMRITSNALAELPVSFASQYPWLRVSSKHDKLTADSQDMQVDFAVMPDAPAGEFKDNVKVQIGSTEYKLQVAVLVSGNSKTCQIELPVHELAIASIGDKIEKNAFVHELSFIPMAREETAQLPVHENALPKLKALHEKIPASTENMSDSSDDDMAAVNIYADTENQSAGSGGFVDQYSRLGWLLLLSLAAAGMLLLLRALLSNRMVRFGLLSLALHLPLVAFFVGYLILSGQSTAHMEKEQSLQASIITEVPQAEASKIEDNSLFSEDILCGIPQPNINITIDKALLDMKHIGQNNDWVLERKSPLLEEPFAPASVESKGMHTIMHTDAHKMDSVLPERVQPESLTYFSNKEVPSRISKVKQNDIFKNGVDSPSTEKIVLQKESALHIVSGHIDPSSMKVQKSYVDKADMAAEIHLSATEIEPLEAHALYNGSQNIKELRDQLPVLSGMKNQKVPSVGEVGVFTAKPNSIKQLFCDPMAAYVINKAISPVITNPVMSVPLVKREADSKKVEPFVAVSSPVVDIGDIDRLTSGGVSSISVVESRRFPLSSVGVASFGNPFVVDADIPEFDLPKGNDEPKIPPIAKLGVVERTVSTVELKPYSEAAVSGVFHTGVNLDTIISVRTELLRAHAAKTDKQVPEIMQIVDAYDAGNMPQVKNLTAPLQPLLSSAEIKTALNVLKDKTIEVVKGEGLSALAPLRGSGVKENTAGFSLPYNPVRISGVKDGKAGLNRPEPLGAVSDAVLCSANLESVALSLGVIGCEPEDIFKYVDGEIELSRKKIAFETTDIQRQQVVAIIETKTNNDVQVKALGDFLMSGGKLWVHDNAELCERLGASPLSILPDASRKILSGGYDLSAGNIESGVYSFVGGGCLISTSAASEKILPLLGRNVLQYFFPQAFERVVESYGNSSSVYCSFSGDEQSTAGWKCESWGAAASLGVTPDGSSDNALLVRVNGAEGVLKSCVSKTYSPVRLDLSRAGDYSLDVYNSAGVKSSLEILFTCYNEPQGWLEYSSMPVDLRPGWNRNLRFDLSHLKIRGGKEYNAHLIGAKNCARIGYLFRMDKPAVFLLDNLGWE